MDNIYAITTEILDLIITIEEGLEHLNKRMGELHFEDTRYLFQDILEAYLSIMTAMEGLMDNLNTDAVLEKSKQLHNAMEQMNQSYEVNKMDKARMDMQFVLVPTFKQWKSAMESCLRPLAQA